MSAVAQVGMERPAILFGGGAADGLLAGARGGANTLDVVLRGVWEDLAAERPARCPVCRGGMAPHHGGAVGGSCTSCGTVID